MLKPICNSGFPVRAFQEFWNIMKEQTNDERTAKAKVAQLSVVQNTSAESNVVHNCKKYMLWMVSHRTTKFMAPITGQSVLVTSPFHISYDSGLYFRISCKQLLDFAGR